MPSIRRLLWISLLTSVTILITVAASFTYWDVSRKINGIFDSQLIEAAHVIKHTVEQSTLSQIDDEHLNELFSPTQTYVPPKIWDDMYGDSLHHFDTRRVFQIWSNDGHLLARTVGAPVYPLANDTAGFTQSLIGKEKWQVYTLIDAHNGLRFQVAQRIDLRSVIIQKIALGNILPDLFIYPIILIMIWFSIRMALKPLQETIDEVKTRELNHLEPIHTQSVPVEILPLVDEFNLLLSRMQESYAREKRFTADAAHELRTPLAALKVQAEVAQSGEYSKEALQKIIIGVDRCAHVVNQLLTLSNLRPDEPLKNVQPLNLSTLAVEIIADLAIDAVHKKIEIAFDDNNIPAPLQGNPTLLQVCMRNLIDNAIRYTPEGGTINVSTGKTKNKIFFCVEDNGPGVPAESYNRIFDRFYRELGTKAQGSGLGLSIVQQIVTLHDGNIEVSKPDKHPGLKICILFS